MARQYDRAVAQADKTLELDATWRPAYLWRVIANEYKGNFAATFAPVTMTSRKFGLMTGGKAPALIKTVG